MLAKTISSSTFQEGVSLVMNPVSKEDTYRTILRNIKALTINERDEISIMATIACEVHHAFPAFHWTGFYRRTDETTLKIGPYQGGHGCLSIDFSRGICGKAAREKKTQLVKDVGEWSCHIACSSNTVSEIVVPVLDSEGYLRAVLDIDSDLPSTFDQYDDLWLTSICQCLASCYTP